MAATANTKKSYTRMPHSMRFKDDVSPAWEVYGPFGRTKGVYEQTVAGSCEPTIPRLGPREWVRLIWVKY